LILTIREYFYIYTFLFLSYNYNLTFSTSEESINDDKSWFWKFYILLIRLLWTSLKNKKFFYLLNVVFIYETFVSSISFKLANWTICTTQLYQFIFEINVFIYETFVSSISFKLANWTICTTQLYQFIFEINKYRFIICYLHRKTMQHHIEVLFISTKSWVCLLLFENNFQ